MQLPFFYKEGISLPSTEQALDNATSKHMVQVLRMQKGAQVKLTDGTGNLFIAEIVDPDKNKCIVKILSTATQPYREKKISIGISLLKNAHRFEWFLEKAAEIGVAEIIPVLCTRTEKQHFRIERLRSILVSAMLQSQQSWLPILHPPVKYKECISQVTKDAPEQKFIAHCESNSKPVPLTGYGPYTNAIILIGPEGDFTIDEIAWAGENNFVPVSLGNTRLRTETAGLVAATILATG